MFAIGLVVVLVGASLMVIGPTDSVAWSDDETRAKPSDTRDTAAGDGDQVAKPVRPSIKPWRAFGRVTDGEGQPLAGIEIAADCGWGTLRRTGVAVSGEDGRYELTFGPTIGFSRASGPTVQAATISARKPGYFEENLNRAGGCLAADAVPSEAQQKRLSIRDDRLFSPDQPLELNFVMRPAASVAGKLVDEQGRPLASYSNPNEPTVSVQIQR